MASLATGFQQGGSLPLFHKTPNSFGNLPFSVGGAPGPAFDSTGKQLRLLTPEEGWSEFFGKPRKALERPASDFLEEEMFDLPKAYEGSNNYMTQILISRITQNEMWILKDFSPWIQFENGMTVNWDVISFNDHMLTRTPEESVSRLLTSRKSAESTTLVRFGISLMLEHGFFNTPKGRMHYAMNIKQISNAIINTAAYGAMNAALTVQQWKDGYDHYRHGAPGRHNLDNFFAQEINTWAMLQKNQEGFSNMIAQMKTTLEQRQDVHADLVCLPNGTGKYMKDMVANQPYAISGIKTGEQLDLISKALGGGFKYRESQYFRQGEARPAHDPSYQERTIGTFFQVSGHFIKSVAPKDFRIGMLDTVIYNEDTDSMEQFSYVDNFRYLGLFDGFGTNAFPPQSRDLGSKYFAGFNTWHQFMTTHSPGYLDYIVKGIHSKSPQQQAKFVSAMLGQNPASAAGSQLPQQGPTSAHVDHHFVTPREVKAVIDQQKAKWQVSKTEEKQIDQLVDRLAKLDVEARGDNHLLTRLKAVVPATSGQGILPQLEVALADELLRFDLDRAVTDIHTNVVVVHPTTIEKAVKAEWPRGVNHAVADAERKTPIWVTLRNSNARVQANVYTGFASSKKLDFASQIFTLTSTHTTLIKLGSYLDQFKENGGRVKVDYSSVPQSEDLHEGEITRAGLLQFSVAVSAVFELLKSSAESFANIIGAEQAAIEERRAMLAKAFTTVGQVVSNKHPVTDSWDHYQDQVYQAERLPFLESQRSIVSLIRLAQSVVRAQLSGKLDQEIFGQAILSFSQQSKTIFTSDNASRLDDQEATGAQLVTPYTQRATEVLSALAPNDLETKYNKAAADTEKLHSHLTQDEKSQSYRGTVVDSFIAFQDSYVQLHQVYATRGWSVKDWQKTVTALHLQYKEKGGSEEIARRISAILRQHFTEAADVRGDVQSSPPAVDKKALEQAEVEIGEQQKLFQLLLERFKAPLVFNASNQRFVGELVTLTKSRQARKAFLSNPNQAQNDPFHFSIASAFSNATSRSPTISSDGFIQGLGTKISPVAAHEALFELYCLLWEKADKVQNSVSSASNANQFIREKILRNGTVTQPLVDKVRAKWGLIDVDTRMDEIPDADKAEESEKNLKRLSELDIILLLQTPGNISHGGFIDFCCKEDVLPPIGFRAIRHCMTYLMGTAWMAQGGGACSNTLFGHADLQVADDAARKIHYGHFTMYFKSVIWSAAHIVHARNVFCQDYHGGNGTMVWDPLSMQDREMYRMGQLERDILLFPVPIGHFTTSRHMDLTGAYHPDLSVSRNDQNETRLPRMEVYINHWSIKQHNQRNPLDTSFFSEASPQTNTVCFQAHQGVWNSTTGYWDRVITEKGHWGPDVKTGCGLVRKGGQGNKVLEKCGYDSRAHSFTLSKA